MTQLAYMILLVAGMTAAQARVVPAELRLARSLCGTLEETLFTCDVGTKVVSICGRADSGSDFRFGRPGRVELQIPRLTLANRAFSGGGEAQVYADTSTHRYIVYERTVRTSFGNDRHHDPQSEAGLVIQSRGQTISNRQCASPATFSQSARARIPLGDYAPH
jgi:hypothetical protein